MTRSILVLNGPNLNMLGVRDPAIYGTASLKDIDTLCEETGHEVGITVTCHQSNDESTLIDWVHEAQKSYDAIVINPGAFAHTSIALLDALTLTKLPLIEVHISNIHAREEFRRHSYISQAAKAVLCGCGIDGYAYAIRTAAKVLNGK